MPDPIRAILEDTRTRLKKAMPENEFVMLVFPIHRDQFNVLGADYIMQVQRRLVSHLQAEISAAVIDQRREQ